MSKLIPGTFLYKIVNGENTEVPERKPFYVQNADDYVRLLKKNYEYYGVPFKHPNVQEMPPYEKVNDDVETHIDNLDHIKVYLKYKVPPIKSVTSALKALGYSQDFIDSMLKKFNKRKELIEKRWKILEKRFDAPSVSAANKKKKADKKAEVDAEVEADAELDDEEEKEKDDDEPEEDEAIEVDDEDGDDVVEDEYISDGGDD